MMRHEVSVMLVGTGAWGRRIAAAIPEVACELGSVVHHRGDRLSDELTSLFAESSGGMVPEYHGAGAFLAALDSMRPDGVIIATPPATHAGMVAECLQRRIPVFVEKPLCLTIGDANHLARLALDAQVPILVDHIHLWNPAWVAIRDQPIAPTKIAVTHIGPTKHTDVSFLWDYGPHGVAQALDLLGRPAKVTGLRMGDLGYVVNMEHAAGGHSHLELYPASEEKKHAALIHGVTADGEPEVLRFDGIRNQAVATGFRSSIGRWELPLETSDRSPLVEALDCFQKAIRGITDPRLGIHLGVDVVKVLAEADRQIREVAKPASGVQA